MARPKVSISRNDILKYYITENKSALQTARILGVSCSTLLKYIDTFGLQRKSMKQIMTGKKHSLETREKMSISHKSLFGSDNPVWKGGRYINSEGYVFIRVNNSYKKEHRVVMEEHLKRSLNKQEHVHHINGNKEDNNIKNLIVLSPSEHSTLHWSDQERRDKQSKKIKEVRSKKFWSIN
jgi:hypothetical protein